MLYGCSWFVIPLNTSGLAYSTLLLYLNFHTWLPEVLYLRCKRWIYHLCEIIISQYRNYFLMLFYIFILYVSFSVKINLNIISLTYENILITFYILNRVRDVLFLQPSVFFLLICMYTTCICVTKDIFSSRRSSTSKVVFGCKLDLFCSLVLKIYEYSLNFNIIIIKILF